jgi:cytochrome c553
LPPRRASPSFAGLARALITAFVLFAAACADFERGASIMAAPDAGAGETATEAGSMASYATDVHALLVSGCRRCHAPDGSAGHTTLVMSGQAETDYPRALMFVKPGDPAGSRLLNKTAGSGHGGGAIYSAGSPEHQKISQWIKEGALP